MTIREYYANYATNKNYGVKMPSGFAATIKEFYNDCISLNDLPKANVLAWHKMFMEYAERPDAVYWIRYYENGDTGYHKLYGRFDNRRACMTRFKDGFSYVFVSNYDVHEIFNMVRLGVTPDVDEFAELMNNRTKVSCDNKSFPDAFPMHYDRGLSCEESQMNCYPNIGNPHYGVLTVGGWYLAHIVGIKAKFKRKNGAYKSLSASERDVIFPRGAISDWKPDAGGIMVRDIDYPLAEEYKDIVKAHFLRFVDPLNYYAVPGEKTQQNETDYVKTQKYIGEYDILNLFMAEQFERLYGKDVMDEFRRAALVDVLSEKMILNVTYKPVNTKSSTKVAKAKKASSVAAVFDVKRPAPAIVYNTGDEESFKSELLTKKRATITWIYADGTVLTKEWNAEKFSPNSGIRSNIQSRPEWRNGAVNGLTEVHLEV